MHRYQKTVEEEIFCSICSKPCKDEWASEGVQEIYNEYALLQATWGYGTKKDCERHFCFMCEDCYDKIRAFIESELKGKIDVSYYL